MVQWGGGVGWGGVGWGGGGGGGGRDMEEVTKVIFLVQNGRKSTKSIGLS